MIKKIKNKYKEFAVYLRLYNLNIALAAALFSLLLIMGSTSYLYMQSPSTIAHRQKLEEYFKQENAKQEYKRLYKYHGYPHVVVYEEGKIPYFYDKHGNKCKFIYPSKEDRLVIKKTQNTEYYDAETMNNEILISHGGF